MYTRVTCGVKYYMASDLFGGITGIRNLWWFRFTALLGRLTTPGTPVPGLLFPAVSVISTAFLFPPIVPLLTTV